MAKRKQAGRGGGRSGAVNGRAAGGGGKTVLGFVAGAAVAAGGVLLYQHTQGRQAGGGALPESAVVPRQTAAVRRGNGTATGAGTEVSAGVGSTAGLEEARGADAAAAPKSEAATAGLARPPFGASEEVFETGARLYAAQCTSCHGRPGRDAATESGELAAGQFWGKGAGVVTGSPAGEIYREIAEGRPERQMPAYQRVLSETQMWDLALLLRSSREEMPEPVERILRGR